MRLILALGIAAALPAAAANLAAPLTVTCEPALPYFCANIHVSCSGRTDVPTFPFRLHALDGRGWIDTDAGAMREHYAGARADWGEDAVILRPRQGAGYIRLLASGRYSFRHYAGEAGIMSYGHCR